ncbi:replication initiation protein, partial [Brucella intermedia 229E]
AIRTEIDNALKIHENVQNLRGNESQNERQQIESNPDSHFEKATAEFIDQRVNEITSAPTEPTVSLDMVLRSCPEITAYAVSSIRHWQDLANTAEKVRSFLGIDGKLYDLAKKVLGPYNASIVIAYILQRFEQIQSAGGYLRILTEKAANGSFSIRPMLMAALNGQVR